MTHVSKCYLEYFVTRNDVFVLEAAILYTEIKVFLLYYNNNYGVKV